MGTRSLLTPASNIAKHSIDRPLVALAWMTASACSFSSMAIFVKRLAPVIPQFELVFFRSSINLVWVIGLMLIQGETFFPRGKPLLVFRGLAGFAGVTCLFYSIGHLPLPIATMLSWCSPIFVILFSRLILNERLPSRSATLILTAFIGLMLLVDPSVGSHVQAVAVPLRAAMIGLMGAAFGGMAYVAVRAATASVGVNGIVFYFVAVSTLISAPLAARDFVSPSFSQAIQLLCLGTFATIGQLTMTRAYRYAPAGIVSLMALLNPAFGAAFGLFLFHESMKASQWLGMSLVGLAIGLLTVRSRARSGVA